MPNEKTFYLADLYSDKAKYDIEKRYAEQDEIKAKAQSEQNDDGILDEILSKAKNAVQGAGIGVTNPIKSILDTMDVFRGAEVENLNDFSKAINPKATEMSKENVAGNLSKAISYIQNEYLGANNPNLNEFSGQTFTERLLNPNWWTSDYGAVRQLPESVANMLAFFAMTRGLGSLGGSTEAIETAIENAAKTALEKFGTKAAEKGYNKIANIANNPKVKEFLPNFLGQGAGFTSTGLPLGLVANSGSIAESLRKQGKSDREILWEMAKMNAEEAPADFLFSMLTGGTFKGAVGKGIEDIVPIAIKSSALRKGAGLLGSAGQ